MHLSTKLSTIFLVLTLYLSPTTASADSIKVMWLGHSTTKITSVEGKVIVIDPFLKKNPKTPAIYRDLEAIGKVDLILATHGHGDHIRDIGELAKLTGATVLGPWGLIRNLGALGVIDASKSIAMNKGGAVEPLGRGVKIHMVPAEHSSELLLPPLGLYDPDLKGPTDIEGGDAVGYVIELEDGFKIYHSGDTDVFGDMALINEFHSPDLALVCIGGFFTMGPERAAYAVRELIKPKKVIPIHYGTYPVINRSPAEFIEFLGQTSIEVLEASPGQELEF